MKTIIHNKFFEFNFILFPIWILPVYFGISNIIKSQEYVFLIFLLLFGETHFASTFLFYFEKKNHHYIKTNFNIYVIIPTIILILYLIVGFVDFKSAVLLGAIASGFHVTRQSVGMQRLYSLSRNTFYECVTYASSFLFMFVGFCRFWLLDLVKGFNINYDIKINYFISTNFSFLFIFVVILFSIIAITEKTNLKKRITNLTGVLIYAPYLFVNNVYDAIIIGVGAHWCQYLAINYKVYFFKQKLDFRKKSFIIFIFSYATIMAVLGYKYNFDKVINYLILIPLSGQFFHYYIDSFLWRFSDPHIREVVGKRLFS